MAELRVQQRPTRTELLHRAEALVPVLAERDRDGAAAMLGANHPQLGPGQCVVPLSQLDVARTRCNQAYVARMALRATNRLLDVSGAHSLFETSAIQGRLAAVQGS